MTRSHAVLSTGLLLLAACDPMARQNRLRQVSSGHVGCDPNKIEIAEDTGGSWVAVCHGKTFRCSTSGGSTSYYPGSSYVTATGARSTTPGTYNSTPGTAHCTEDTEATAEAAAKTAAAPSEPMTVHIAAAKFTLPGGFRADPYKGHKTFHADSGWDRFVYLDVESYAGTAEEYAGEKFAGAKLKNFKVSGAIAVVAMRDETVFKKSMRLSTMIKIVEGEAYALTCAAALDDDDDQNVPSFCVSTLKSLRIGQAE